MITDPHPPSSPQRVYNAGMKHALVPDQIIPPTSPAKTPVSVRSAQEYAEASKAVTIPHPYQKTPPTEPGGHQADEKLWDMAKEAATKEEAEDGFVSSQKSNDRTGETEGLLIYAWGPSAQILADLFNIQPAEGGCKFTGQDLKRALLENSVKCMLPPRR